MTDYLTLSWFVVANKYSSFSDDIDANIPSFSDDIDANIP